MIACDRSRRQRKTKGARLWRFQRCGGATLDDSDSDSIRSTQRQAYTHRRKGGQRQQHAGGRLDVAAHQPVASRLMILCASVVALIALLLRARCSSSASFFTRFDPHMLTIDPPTAPTTFTNTDIDRTSLGLGAVRASESFLRFGRRIGSSPWHSTGAGRTRRSVRDAHTGHRVLDLWASA